MKKTANKQKREPTVLKRALESDGRKLRWVSESTGINYQRLQRIVNQGYEPTISEAARIANLLDRPLQELFPSLELSNAVSRSSRTGTQPPSSLKAEQGHWGPALLL